MSGSSSEDNDNRDNRDDDDDDDDDDHSESSDVQGDEQDAAVWRQRYERSKRKWQQATITIQSLIEQFTEYKETVEEEKTLVRARALLFARTLYACFVKAYEPFAVGREARRRATSHRSRTGQEHAHEPGDDCQSTNAHARARNDRDKEL